MRIYVNEPAAGESIVTPDAVYEAMKDLSKADQERFVILILCANNKIITTEVISIGGISSSLVDPKILFRRILQHGGSAFIGVHNHPSGNIEPSRQDRDLTQQLKEGAKVLSIRFLDHVIIGDGYYSFQEHGMV